jgi:hypothetical protein
MSQVTSRVMAALAGVALASLPLVAQSTSSPSPQPDTRTQQQSQSKASDDSPPHHLSEARRVLNSINVNSLRGEARTQVSELRTHFQQLDQAWLAKSMTSRGEASTAGHAAGHAETTGATGSSTSGTAAAAGTAGTPEQAGATGATRQSPRAGSPAAPATATGDWTTHYQALDKALERLLGTGGASAGASSLDAATRTKLQEFRKHLDQFRAAARAEGGVSQEYASSTSAQRDATASAAQAEASTATGAASPSGSSSTTQTGQSSHSTHTQPTTNTDVTSQPPAQTATSGSGMPVDGAAITRLTSQIDDLLGSASTSSTSSSTSATGAVGTSGTAGRTGASGTVCVDRGKLEQLRRDIQALQSGSQRQ